MRVIARIHRGDTFGERGVVLSRARSCTVESSTEMQLAVAASHDYLAILGRRLAGPQLVRFCRPLPLFERWPLHVLRPPDNLRSAFYRKSVAIVADSRRNEWIFIIRSGEAEVLQKHDLGRRRRKEAKLCKSEAPPAGNRWFTCVDRLRSGDFFGLEHFLDRSDGEAGEDYRAESGNERKTAKGNECDGNECDGNESEGREREGREDEGREGEGREGEGRGDAAEYLSLVSSGCEVLMMLRQFFLAQADLPLLRRLLEHSAALRYPTGRQVRRQLRRRADWILYRRQVLRSVVDRQSIDWQHWR